jgi:iron complex outermembrane receptor protein
MQLTRKAHTALAFASTSLAIASLIAVMPAAASAQTRQARTTFAQNLVEATHAKHPEADEIGIITNTPKGCFGIASTDKTDVGEKCEAEDMKPLKTGRPFVAKEGAGFDVSVPLHDATGKSVGALGIEFKAAPGQTEASVTASALKIESEMAAQIPSKAKLLMRSR